METATRGVCRREVNAPGRKGESRWVRTMWPMALLKRLTATSHHAATMFVALCLAGLAAVVGYTVRNFDLQHDAAALLRWHGAAWVLFAAAAAAVRWVRPRMAIVLIVAGGLALGVVSLLEPPRTSSDAARYVFDGIVQQSGKSPYEHVPVDPELTPQRTDWLFPAPEMTTTASGEVAYDCPGWEPHPVWQNGVLVCTAINRPEVNTIYPGAAEGYFLLVAAVSPDSAQYLPLQIAGLLLVTAVTILLLWALRRHGRDPRWAVLWAWCPLVASEAVNNAHVDALGALFALVGVVLIAGKRHFLGGFAVGAAIAVKLLPALLLPALIRSRPVRVIAGVLAAFAAAYLPYVLASGTKVIGYLPGYLSEEGYDDGPSSRFALLRLILPENGATVAGLAVLAVIACCVLARVNPDRPWTAAAVMFGAALLVATPSYPWYALLLIPLIVLAGRPEWLAVSVAPLALYLSGPIAAEWAWGSSLARAQLAFGIAALVVVAAAMLRLRLVRRGVPLVGGVSAVEVPYRGEAALTKYGQRVSGTDAVLAVDNRRLITRKGRNQLGYALLGSAAAVVVGLALRRRNYGAQRDETGTSDSAG